MKSGPDAALAVPGAKLDGEISNAGRLLLRLLDHVDGSIEDWLTGWLGGGVTSGVD